MAASAIFGIWKFRRDMHQHHESEGKQPDTRAA
jgi:hypothetical protein